MSRPRPSWHHTFMKMCIVLRERSRCLKYQTAAILTKGTQILAIGYNGTPAGAAECCDYWREMYGNIPEEFKEEHLTFAEWVQSRDFSDRHSKWAHLEEMHAEANALMQVAKKDIDGTCALYTYYSPCEQCAKQIVAYGIKHVYYAEMYPGRSRSGIHGITFLTDNRTNCVKIDIE
jgi:dCMP deaminase